MKIEINMPIVIAIVGPSGSGKTTMANIMAENGIPTIVSFTTRPMRDGETNGKEHWFVTPEDKPDASEMIAYTNFGGYEYWATLQQTKHKICTYVIDEKGLIYLKEKFPNSFIVFSVYLDRNINDRIGCGVDEKRCKRDSDRTEIPLKEYDYIIHNNYSLEEFEEKIKQLTIDLLK
ncbi:guanylate kinase [Bacteroides stercoris]|jgi:putative guanylate kinase (GMP kinase)|uniref:guanylate kinase n=1 Tax=Bacteroides stercoris TaxID=46506 RepID=UPI0018A085F8|nr:guanylate kinase [Bacteroides stercoris]MDC2300186.1 guanylate kinase [Bacteroides stercoris]MDC2306869.1 guanylate kinase [Bacteroides stercoris]